MSSLPAQQNALADHRHRITQDWLEDDAVIPAKLADSVYGGTPTTIDPDDAGAAGTAATVSRSDHQHAITTNAPSDVGIANAEGAGTGFARDNHVHKARGQLLDSTTVAGASVQSVTFSSIPATFDNLYLVFDANSDTAAGAVVDVDVRFNADSGANYHSQTNRDGTFAQSLSDTGIKITEIDGTSSGRPGSGTVTVLNYLEATKARIVIGEGFSLQTGSIVDFRIIGTWNNTANAITSLTVTTSAAGTKFAIGSKFWLYGE